MKRKSRTGSAPFLTAGAAMLGAMMTTGAATLRAGETYFARPDGIWNSPDNWDAGLPTAGDDAVIGSSKSGKTNPATAWIHTGDNATAARVRVGQNNAKGCGALNMDGGALVVTDRFYLAPDGTGTVRQTGGTVTLPALEIGTGGSAVGCWDLAGGVVSNSGAVLLGYNRGGSATMLIHDAGVMVGGEFQLGSWQDSWGKGKGALIVADGGTLRDIAADIKLCPAYAEGADGTFAVSNAAVNLSPRGISAAYYVSALAHIFLAKASLTCNGMWLADRGTCDMHVSSGTTVTNEGSLSVGVNHGGQATLEMANSQWEQQQGMEIGCWGGTRGAVSLAGGALWRQRANTTIANGGSGRLALSNATFLCDSNTISIARWQGAEGKGQLSLAGNSLLTAGSINVGSGGGSQGLVTLAGQSVVTNYGALSLGTDNGGEGIVVIGAGQWWQIGDLNIASIFRGDGQLWVTGGVFTLSGNANLATAGGYAENTAAVVVSNGVFRQADGRFIIGNGIATGRVDIAGTQRIFQVPTLDIRRFCTVTNHVAGHAGGLDITATDAGALKVADGAAVAVVYTRDPEETGMYWGLRWLGTNHVQTLTALADAVPPKLTWDVSALNPAYRSKIGFYTDDAYTYLGIPVTRVIRNVGLLLLAR